MPHNTNRTNHTPLVVLTLAMALGPLTALSVGSRYADEETLTRAQAGAETIKRLEIQAAIANPAQREEPAQAYADAMAPVSDSDSDS
jgi:hypothetical protein